MIEKERGHQKIAISKLLVSPFLLLAFRSVRQRESEGFLLSKTAIISSPGPFFEITFPGCSGKTVISTLVFLSNQQLF